MTFKHGSKPPIIIIGMHRSGTTMITQMLAACGLFVGQGEMAHEEAPFFQNINNLLLNQVGNRWDDNPDVIDFLLANKEVRAIVGDYIRYLFKTRHAISFLGWRRYFRYRDIARLDIPWGWKDPRNTLTLPVWLDIFPQARIVHIYRHGIDVANSLSSRYQRKFKVTTRRDRFWQYWLRPKRGRFTNSKVTQISLAYNFELWEKYMQRARYILQTIPNEVMEIQYELFLQQPVRELLRLVQFCGLMPDENLIAALVERVQAGRAYSYQQDPQLCAFAAQMDDRLAVFGYTAVV